MPDMLESSLHSHGISTLSVMVIVVGDRISDPSSNSGQGCFISH